MRNNNFSYPWENVCLSISTRNAATYEKFFWISLTLWGKHFFPVPLVPAKSCLQGTWKMGINFRCHSLSSSFWPQTCPSAEQTKIPFEGYNVPPATSSLLLLLLSFGASGVAAFVGSDLLLSLLWQALGWLCCVPWQFLFPAGRWTRASTGAARTASPRRTWRTRPARCQKRRKASRPWCWTTPTLGKQLSAWWLLTNLS